MKLPKAYEPKKYEEKIYKLWEEQGAFVPKNRASKESFSMVMPPPNANANIHLGTAITLDLEDVAVRYNRMLGKNTLYLPGADHAGFETQSVYEKHLAKQGKSRFDFTREELYKQIWNFVDENKSNYESQFRSLGVSPDWSTYTYTLDEKIVKRAYITFKKMWEKGLIYRGERLVNFCTFHGTGFADIEVVHKESTGHLWHIKYPLTDGSGEVVVATTRPETMLGDTAVAVHPNDKRYTKFVGKTIKLPLTNREIPIIADDFVDQAFGTGAVKITPAHDQNDYDMAERHDLPKITVIGFNGQMNHEVPEAFVGLDVAAAREKVVNALVEQGSLVKREDITHNVGHCYKCNTVIEPLLREQWFIDMNPLAKKAIQALKANKITFYPSSKKAQLVTYLEGLRDWNISRQIAWGIPIPAFQNVDEPHDWIYDDRVQEQEVTVDGKTYRRDPEVFDTWFSSSSWPYATLDFPDGKNFKEHYPLSLLETGGEILYPWVSRMIMLGLFVTGEVPFKAVYIHGYVMAEDGSKMSKSLGNVVDPIPVINEFGSDALRMGLISGRTPAVNRGYDPRRIEDARNFCNKLWNIARFVEGLVDNTYDTKVEPETLADHWILCKLQRITEVVSLDLDSYRFAEAYDKLYHFVWDDFADWYIEASKSTTNKGVLVECLNTILKLLHPFAPFVTETIWQELGWHKELLVTTTWPKPHGADAKLAGQFEKLQKIVVECRQLIKATGLKKPHLVYTSSKLIHANTETIQRLARLGKVQKKEQGTGLALTSSKNVWLDIDVDVITHYIHELHAKQTEQGRVIKSLEARLANSKYVQNAPKAVVQQTKDQLAEAYARNNQLVEELTHFQ